MRLRPRFLSLALCLIVSPAVLSQGLITDRDADTYKLERFDFEDGKDAAGIPVPIALMPEAKETVKLMNNMAKEGWVVRELFKSKKVSVLMERSR